MLMIVRGGSRSTLIGRVGLVKRAVLLVDGDWIVRVRGVTADLADNSELGLGSESDLFSNGGISSER